MGPDREQRKKIRGNSGRLRRNSGGEDVGGDGGTARNGDKEDPTRTSQSERDDDATK